MNALILAATLLSLGSAQPGGGQAEAAKSPIIASPSDVDSIDHIVAVLYAVISGPIGQKRDWDRMRSLFVPKATMGAMYVNRAGETKEADFSVDRYVELSGPSMEKSGFFEKEIDRHQEEYAHIAHVFSTYESRYHPEDKPFERGINSLQLYNDGKRWWVRSILWEGETPTQKLPAKYTRHH